MKTALSVILFIFGAFSILFSFVGMSVLFDPNETQKGIDVFLIIFFLGLGVSLIILGVIILKSELAKNKAIKLNAMQYHENQYNNNPLSNQTVNNNSENPYEVNFNDDTSINSKSFSKNEF